MTKPAIASFDGVNFFLSNFYPSPAALDGVDYPTVENAFQAAKTLGDRFAFAHVSPAESKKLGRQVFLRDGWDGMRIEVMRGLLSDKFRRNDALEARLLRTGDAQLIEGNTWGDKFWGVDSRTGEGYNNLGKLLMELRAKLLAEQGDTVEP